MQEYVPAYEKLQAQFRILEETNNNLKQQNLNLDAELQVSKLAHEEALQLLNERDDQDVSFASASDQEEQQHQQENKPPQQSPTHHNSAFYVQQDPGAVPQPPEMANDAVETQITHTLANDVP